ncbi:MAG: hypothetical protein ACOYOE_01070 [Chlorobium sp.]
MVCFVEYCIPAFNILQDTIATASFQAILVEPFPTDKKRHRFLSGKVWAEGGRLLCKVSPKIESHMITSLTGSNCLVEAEPSFAPLPAGSEVTCTMLPWAALCACYEPKSRSRLILRHLEGDNSLSAFLDESRIEELIPQDAAVLQNINEPESQQGTRCTS